MAATLDTNNPAPKPTPEQLKSLATLSLFGPKQNAASSGKSFQGGLMGGMFSKSMLAKLKASDSIGKLSKFAQTQAGLQRGYVTDATAEATQSLMQGYRQAYAQRAAGIAGSYGLQADQLGSEMLGQGLSADIARRMMAGQRGASLQQMGEAQGGLASEMYDNLARLQKGTGGELAAIGQAETEQYLAPHIAKMSGDAMKASAKSQAKGGILGGLLGGIATGIVSKI